MLLNAITVNGLPTDTVHLILDGLFGIIALSHAVEVLRHELALTPLLRLAVDLTQELV